MEFLVTIAHAIAGGVESPLQLTFQVCTLGPAEPKESGGAKRAKEGPGGSFACPIVWKNKEFVYPLLTTGTTKH